jgi:hypothetical protein
LARGSIAVKRLKSAHPADEGSVWHHEMRDSIASKRYISIKDVLCLAFDVETYALLAFVLNEVQLDEILILNNWI